MKRGPYRIEYTAEAVRHVQALPAFKRRLVLDWADLQLRHQPTLATRNRKLLRANPLATWELRIHDARVYFDVEESERIVTIRAVGRKVRERVIIGGEEIDL